MYTYDDTFWHTKCKRLLRLNGANENFKTVEVKVCVSEGGQRMREFVRVHTCVCVWCKKNSLWMCRCVCFYGGGWEGLGDYLKFCFNVMMRVHVHVQVCVSTRMRVYAWPRWLGSMSYRCACLFMSVCTCPSVYVYVRIATLHQPIYQHTLSPSHLIHTLWLICFHYHHGCQDVDCDRLLSLSGRRLSREEGRREGGRERGREWRTDGQIDGWRANTKGSTEKGWACTQTHTHTHTHTRRLHRKYT